MVFDGFNGCPGGRKILFGQISNDGSDLRMLEAGIVARHQRFHGQPGVSQSEVVENLGSCGVEFGIVFGAALKILQKSEEGIGIKFLQGFAEVSIGAEEVLIVDKVENPAGFPGGKWRRFCDPTP